MVGRVPAVLLVVTLVFAALGLAGLALTWQMDQLVDDLPVYRANIRTKIADVRLAGRGSRIEKLQETLEGIKTDLETSEAPKGTVLRPLVVASNQVTGFLGFAWLGPVVGPLTTAGLVAVMVVFMLLERRDLRDRLIGLIGHGQLATTTKAFDEAGSRISRQLLMQSLVSVLWGLAAFVGLSFLHVPYPLVWATLGAAFRFIPYIGPVLGAGAPILVSLAALDGWTGPLMVLALFVVLELFTNLVLETVLYAGAVGVSQVVLLVSVAFWTWLWGPLGLLMASPLTVCVVVLGKHVPGLTFVGLLMDDTPALAPEYGFYQRLLARDQSEAAELIDSHIKTGPPASVYDALLLPALSYAERDRLEHRLAAEEETAVIDATRELIADAAEIIRRHAETEPPATAADPSLLGPREPLRVLGYAVNGAADEVALGRARSLASTGRRRGTCGRRCGRPSIHDRVRRARTARPRGLPREGCGRHRRRVGGRPQPVRCGGTRHRLCAAGMGHRRRGLVSRCVCGGHHYVVVAHPRRTTGGGGGRWFLGVTAAGFVAYGFCQIIHARSCTSDSRADRRSARGAGAERATIVGLSLVN